MKILIVNQAFYPDQSASSQYAYELSLELVEKGHEVSVVTANRGYLDPTQKYKANEEVNGIKLHRASTIHHRRTKFLRILFAIWTNISLFLEVIRSGSYDKTIVLTSPPMLGFFISFLPKRIIGKLIHWALDINPDQAIKAKWVKNHLLTALLLKAQKIFFTRCDKIIVLDRFMQELLLSKGVEQAKLVVCSLWWSKKVDEPVPNPTRFRIKNNLQTQKIVMYAGNHSICHPLDKLLEIALTMKEDDSFVFVFVGGGSRVREVLKFKEQHQLENILHFDYVANNELKDLLLSADIHVVSQGEDYVGIVHPSKIYAIIALYKRVIIFSPKNSSVVDICNGYKLSYFSDKPEKDINWIKSIVNLDQSEVSQLRADSKYIVQSYDKNVVLHNLLTALLTS